MQLLFICPLFSYVCAAQLSSATATLPATILVHVFPSAQSCLDVGSVKATAVSRTTFHLRCGVSEKFYMSRSRDHWAHWLLPHDEGSISSLFQEYFARIFGALCQPVLSAAL